MAWGLRDVSARRTRGGQRVVEVLEPRRLLTAIASGQTLAGTIAVTGEQDDFTFSVAAGERIVVALARTSAAGFVPQLDLFAPDNTRVTGSVDANGLNIEVTAEQTGTYRAVVAEQFDDATGSYNITLAKLPGPQSNSDADGGTLASGQRRTGAIGVGDLDVYTFTATDGGRVILGIGEAGATAFVPQLDVYDPAGARVTGSVDQTGFNLEFTPDAGGTYYAVVREQFSDATGNYRLSLLSLPGAIADDALDDDGGAIVSGQRLSGNVDAPGDLDAFTFSASQGHRIILGIGDSGATSFVPQLDVYGPDGARVTGSVDQTGFNLEFTAPAGGTYVAVVREQFSDATGNYQLSLLSIPGVVADDAYDTDGGTIASGQRVPGTIDAPGDLDAFTFSASQGNRVVLGIGDVGATEFVAELDVYGPDGARITGSADQTGFNLEFTAPLGGTYYAVVREQFSDATGAYQLSLLTLPGAVGDDVFDDDGGAALTSGERRHGTIDAPGDLDAFTFTASAGDRIILGMGDTRGTTFVGQLDLYGPDGARLTGSADQTGLILEITAATGGTYYAVVREQFSDVAGAYALAFVRLPGAQAADPLDPDGGTLTSGQTRLGSIPIGDLDVFTFAATAGGAFTVNITETGGNTSMVPQIDLYRPDGARVTGDAGGTGATINVTNAPATGTYYVVAREQFGDAIGGYAIALNATPAGDNAGPVIVDRRFRPTPVHAVEFKFNETITGLDVADVTVVNLGTGQPVPSAAIQSEYLAPDFIARFTFPGLGGGGSLSPGNYRATFAGGSVQDASGNPFGAAVSFDFTVAPPPAATVQGRRLFYNNSAFDGSNPAPNPQDDGAVAPDKQALLPGGTASFANYSSYSRGLNGIMIDIAGLPQSPYGLTGADFLFHAANGATNPATWPAAPAPSSITVRPGAGANGSTRVTLTWPDWSPATDRLQQTAIKKWLRVTVRATPATGLTAPDVFYFGNAVGESGNSNTDAVVNGTDFAGARDNQRGSQNLAPIDWRWDYNRDRLVNGTDLAIARDNTTSTAAALQLFTAPPALSAGAATPTRPVIAARISSVQGVERSVPVSADVLSASTSDVRPGAVRHAAAARMSPFIGRRLVR